MPNQTLEIAGQQIVVAKPRPDETYYSIIVRDHRETLLSVNERLGQPMVSYTGNKYELIAEIINRHMVEAGYDKFSIFVSATHQGTIKGVAVALWSHGFQLVKKDQMGYWVFGRVETEFDWRSNEMAPEDFYT